jgi:hypothetical protein
LMELRKELAKYRLRAARANLHKGTLVDAFMRIMAYLVDEMHTVQYRPFQRMREMAREYLGARQPTIAELKEAARRQGAIVALDPKEAIEALAEIVPDMPTRRALLAAVYRIATVSGPLEGERRERFREVQRALGVEPGSEKSGLPPPDGADSGGAAPEAGAGGTSSAVSGDAGVKAASDEAAEVQAAQPVLVPAASESAPKRTAAKTAKRASAAAGVAPKTASPAAAKSKRVPVKAKAAAGRTAAPSAAKTPAATKTARRASSTAAAAPAHAAGSPASRRRTTRATGE